MSRRGQSRAVVVADADVDADAHNTLEIPDSDVTDPVIAAIRFGMQSIMKIANDTVPHCPGDDESIKRGVAEKMETSLLQLVEAELTYSQTSAIVNQVVDELSLQDNPDMDTKEFLENVDSISELANQRIAEYKATLTHDILKGHPVFIRMKLELQALLDQVDEEEEEEEDEGNDYADAETEPDEIDPDDSVMAEDADFQIPELDPISKQPLRDPVRNRHCNHIYGKSAMVQLVKKNPRTRCPAMGCDNPNFVKASDLIDDPMLTARVTGQPIPSTSRARATSTPKATPKKSAKRGRRRR